MNPTSRELFGALVEHCSEGVLAVARSDGSVLAVNQRFAELTGRPLEGLAGTDAVDLFDHMGDPPYHRAGLHEDVALRRFDDYPVFVALTVTHLEHPRHGAIAACICRDTTERRFLERELLTKHIALHAAHNELADAVRSLADRNRELSALGAELSVAARRAYLGELSAGIAHSLNNPLAALASTQRQIAARVEAQAPTLFPEIERYFRRSRDAIARLEQTLRQLRQAHRGGAEPQVVRAVEVADEIEVALSLFEQRMRCITVSLRITRPLHAVACPHDLQQALWNLVDNALLAMPLGGSLDITASAQDAGRVVVAIEDSGPGVPEALRPTLFQPFSTGRKDGTGLGLSTSRRLVRAWGGDVRLADSEHGARFEIHLPTGERPCNATAS